MPRLRRRSLLTAAAGAGAAAHLPNESTGRPRRAGLVAIQCLALVGHHLP